MCMCLCVSTCNCVCICDCALPTCTQHSRRPGSGWCSVASACWATPSSEWPTGACALWDSLQIEYKNRESVSISVESRAMCALTCATTLEHTRHAFVHPPAHPFQTFKTDVHIYYKYIQFIADGYCTHMYRDHYPHTYIVVAQPCTRP